MEDNKNLCRGCLCGDRKMLILNDYLMKECLWKIMSDIPMIQREHIPVWLCWECDAQLARFTKFKQQVIQSFEIFENFSKQNVECIQLKQASKLSIKKVFDILIPPYETEEEDNLERLIKIEVGLDSKVQPEVEVKEEDNISVFSNLDIDDDNKALAEVAKRKKKKTRKVLNGSKKKRNKLNDELEVIEMYKKVELSRVELEEERRLMATKEEYVNAMFRCEKCIISFPNADDLKDHFNLKHELNASHYKCNICECSFAIEVSYSYHTQRHICRYECAVCSERFTSKRDATKHYNLVHCRSIDLNYEICKIQNGHTNTMDEMQDDSSQQEVPCFPCDVCAKTFKWKTSLRKHLETHRIETGQKRKPYCEPCRLSFTTTSNLQKHVKTSSKHQIQLKLRKLKETLIEEPTNPEKQQARIAEIKCSVNSERQQFPCPQCDKRFQWRGNLLRHLNSHAARAKGELVCEPCKRTFSSIATYQQHMKISKKHVSENDFKYMCSDCGKRFANKTRLKDHVDWEHLKNFVHTCPVCQKVFKSHTSLYLHKQVVHKKDHAEHLCDHCGKPFPNQAKLRGHVAALHSREAPYRCGSCSARFSWHSCLSRHVRRVHRRDSALPTA